MIHWLPAFWVCPPTHLVGMKGSRIWGSQASLGWVTKDYSWNFDLFIPPSRHNSDLRTSGPSTSLPALAFSALSPRLIPAWRPWHESINIENQTTFQPLSHWTKEAVQGDCAVWQAPGSSKWLPVVSYRGLRACIAGKHNPALDGRMMLHINWKLWNGSRWSVAVLPSQGEVVQSIAVYLSGANDD